jgi:hypothetical protein
VRRLLGVKPGDRLVFDGNGSGMRVHPVRTEDPFEKYRGIGTPGIGAGEKAVIQWMRRLRGR